MKRVAVFCGSSIGGNRAYFDAAVSLGEALVQRGLGLVYGGGRVGLMGAIADAVLARGGDVRGVIPKALATKELAHTSVTELLVVASMHERKAKMALLANGFIALPGGFGTLDELYEAITWAQLGLHQKPIGLLNVNGYFDALIAFADRAVADGFVSQPHRELVLVANDADTLLQRMTDFVPTGMPKWIEPAEA